MWDLPWSVSHIPSVTLLREKKRQKQNKQHPQTKTNKSNNNKKKQTNKAKNHGPFFSQQVSNTKSTLVRDETLWLLPPLRAEMECEQLEFVQTFCIQSQSPELLRAPVLSCLKHCFLGTFPGFLPLLLSTFPRQHRFLGLERRGVIKTFHVVLDVPNILLLCLLPCCGYLW